MEFEDAKKIVKDYYLKKLKEYNNLEYLVRRHYIGEIKSISKLLELLEDC
jgi:hypothetical protein